MICAGSFVDETRTMSTKKVPKQSTLASFFKKTPSKESPISSPRISSPVIASSPVSTATPTRTVQTDTSSPVLNKTSSDEDEEDVEDTVVSTRPRKRRKMVKLDDSDEDYCDSLDDQDMLDVEAFSSATTVTTKSNRSSMRPPPKIALDLSSTKRLEGFMASPRSANRPGENPTSDVLPVAETQGHTPALARESSSRVSAIVPMSKQDQLVEGG